MRMFVHSETRGATGMGPALCAALILTGTACLSAPDLEGRSCSANNECPGGFDCLPSGVCGTPIAGTGSDGSGDNGSSVDDKGTDDGGSSTPSCSDTVPACDCGEANCIEGTWICPEPEGYGLLCANDATCGARIDCFGACTGGDYPPDCGCGAALCELDGSWRCEGDASCCDESAGQSCYRAGYCGATVDCDGRCTGGTPEPECECGAAVCRPDGTWAPCDDPADLGQRCDNDRICGGTRSCTGCTGGQAKPSCDRALSCQPDGTWSSCPPTTCEVSRGDVPDTQHGASCAGIATDTWRCAWDTQYDTQVTQVCRGGSWLNNTFSPSCCGLCDRDNQHNCN